MMAAGEKLGRGGRFQFKEPRSKAAIAYSPNKPMGCVSLGGRLCRHDAADAALHRHRGR